MSVGTPDDIEGIIRARTLAHVMRTLAALLLAFLFFPTASAQEGDPLCIIFFEPSVDFRLVDVKADLILDPDQRANLSAEVDADGDGTITAAEVSTYENSTMLVVTEQAQYGERLLYMDGNLPTRMTVYTKLRNWTGPVEEARKGVVTELREYHTVPANDETGHLLTGGLYAPAGDSLARRRPASRRSSSTRPMAGSSMRCGIRRSLRMPRTARRRPRPRRSASVTASSPCRSRASTSAANTRSCSRRKAPTPTPFAAAPELHPSSSLRRSPRSRSSRADAD